LIVAEVEISGDTLALHVTGEDRVLALKSSLSVPLAHVAAIDQDVTEASVIYHGLRLPGTGIPGVVTAGSFLRDGQWTFWDVHDPAKSVIVRLRDEHYTRLVVGVDDPSATVERVREAIAGRT